MIRPSAHVTAHQDAGVSLWHAQRSNRCPYLRFNVPSRRVSRDTARRDTREGRRGPGRAGRRGATAVEAGVRRRRRPASHGRRLPGRRGTCPAHRGCHAGARVLKVHEHLSGESGDPCRGRVRGCTGDPHTPGGLLDYREDVQVAPVRVLVAKKSAAWMACARQRRNVAPVVQVCSDAVPMPCSLRMFRTVDAATVMSRTTNSLTERMARGRLGRLGREALAWRRRSRSRCRHGSVPGEKSSDSLRRTPPTSP